MDRALRFSRLAACLFLTAGVAQAASPFLSVSLVSPTSVQVSWSTNFTGGIWQLMYATNLSQGTWQPVPQTPLSSEPDSDLGKDMFNYGVVTGSTAGTPLVIWLFTPVP